MATRPRSRSRSSSRASLRAFFQRSWSSNIAFTAMQAAACTLPTVPTAAPSATMARCSPFRSPARSPSRFSDGDQPGRNRAVFAALETVLVVQRVGVDELARALQQLAHALPRQRDRQRIAGEVAAEHLVDEPAIGVVQRRLEQPEVAQASSPSASGRSAAPIARRKRRGRTRAREATSPMPLSPRSGSGDKPGLRIARRRRETHRAAWRAPSTRLGSSASMKLPPPSSRVDAVGVLRAVVRRISSSFAAR